jgi:hypothetical protein
MKKQRFGIEIEMTGITRAKAAEVAVRFFGSTAKLEHIGGSYDEYRVTTADGRAWKFVSDASILTKKKENGQIKTASKDYSVELVSPILTYEDVENLQELVRQLRHAGALSDSQYQCGIHIHLDGKNHTPTSLKNLINLMASKEELIYKSLEIDPARIRYCKKVNETLLKTINKEKPSIIEDLADMWYEGYGQESRNRHYHNSRYHGLNLHSVFDKGTVEFRLFNGTLHAGKIRSYLVFCLAISHQAIKQRTASPRRTFTDNEKYTFRCWLLRLGLIGDEFKNCREHLMENLTGNSAWRNRDAA